MGGTAGVLRSRSSHLVQLPDLERETGTIKLHRVHLLSPADFPRPSHKAAASLSMEDTRWTRPQPPQCTSTASQASSNNGANCSGNSFYGLPAGLPLWVSAVKSPTDILASLWQGHYALQLWDGATLYYRTTVTPTGSPNFKWETSQPEAYQSKPHSKCGT